MNIATLLSVILGVLAAVASTVAIGTDDGYPVDFKRGWRAHKYRKNEVADENACFAKCAELIDPQGTPLCTGIKWRRGSNKPCRVFRGPYSGTCGNQHPNPPQNRDTCWDVEDPNPTDAVADPGPPSGTYQEDFHGCFFTCVRDESSLECTEGWDSVNFNVNGNELTHDWGSGTGIWSDSDKIFTFPDPWAWGEVWSLVTDDLE